jgi:hypothetical protein
MIFPIHVMAPRTATSFSSEPKKELNLSYLFWKLPSYQVAYLIPIFRCLGVPKKIYPSPRPCVRLAGCPLLPLQYIRSYPPNQGPVVYVCSSGLQDAADTLMSMIHSFVLGTLYPMFTGINNLLRCHNTERQAPQINDEMQWSSGTRKEGWPWRDYSDRYGSTNYPAPWQLNDDYGNYYYHRYCFCLYMCYSCSELRNRTATS